MQINLDIALSLATFPFLATMAGRRTHDLKSVELNVRKRPPFTGCDLCPGLHYPASVYGSCQRVKGLQHWVPEDSGEGANDDLAQHKAKLTFNDMTLQQAFGAKNGFVMLMWVMGLQTSLHKP